MRLVIPEFDIDIFFLENKINILTVENRNAFASILSDLWNQYNGSDGNSILSENDTLLRMSKISECIYNVYSINCNDKKIISKIYQELVQIAGEAFIEKTAKVNSILVEYLDYVLQTVPYNLTQSLELDIAGLLKLYDVRVETDATTLLENLINYMKLASQVLGKKLFVFAELKHFLDVRSLKSLYEFAFYEKIYILIIEGDDSGHLEEEKHLILDNDLCIIDL